VSPDLVLPGEAAREIVGGQRVTTEAGFEDAIWELLRPVDPCKMPAKAGPVKAARAIAITKFLFPKSTD